MPPALVAALPAITAAASAVGGIASAAKAGKEGDRADKVLRQGESERKNIADSLAGGPAPIVGLGDVGVGGVGTGKVGVGPVGSGPVALGGNSSLLKKPMSNGMGSNLGGLSKFG
jgi:hypothetical protein